MHIEKIISLGLWPESKKTTTQKGIDELENLGYNLYYIGKNADLYTCPGNDPKVLLVRSDRTSVFDIPLNLEIEGKGIIQTAISNAGAAYAKNSGIRTAILDESVDPSLQIAPRCQMMELCKPLEAKIDGQLCQFEFIFRNYLTGSLYDACQNNQDPYGLELPQGLQQWHKFDTPIFTPTTKGVKDMPLKSQIVRDQFPDIISSLEKLFKNFTDFAYENGIVVVDTKFEIFVNSKGEWVLGDEVLTPESSRFIALEDFNKGDFISMDKQILRDFAKANNWKEQAKDLQAGQKLDVEVPQSIKNQVLSGYETINKRLHK
ncbi:MAG: phosphoribosylaminoimidazolesuccinocarboxamide synthase [Campylobacterales bacterium]|nr:phosphoribosylaminoimidazolesuccinocarboxamide synthase [Campylobacterales bacterium]